MTSYNAANLPNLTVAGTTYIGPVTANGVITTTGGVHSSMGDGTFTFSGNNLFGFVLETTVTPGTISNNDIWHGGSLISGNLTTPANPALGDTFKIFDFDYPVTAIRMSGSQVAYFGATNAQTSAGGLVSPANLVGLNNFCYLTMVCTGATGATSTWIIYDVIGQLTLS